MEIKCFIFHSSEASKERREESEEEAASQEVEEDGEDECGVEDLLPRQERLLTGLPTLLQVAATNVSYTSTAKDHAATQMSSVFIIMDCKSY